MSEFTDDFKWEIVKVLNQPGGNEIICSECNIPYPPEQIKVKEKSSKDGVACFELLCSSCYHGKIED